jgi:hypothetical protein
VVSAPDIPGHKVGGVLGQGGFATVYRAWQIAVGREVAVKVDNRVLATERDRRRFVREVTAAGRLSGHPHVIGVYDAGTLHDGRPFLVMELCPGGSLADAVRSQGPMSPGRVRDIGIRIADALAAAHAAGVLHRDIKPANILINHYGVVGLSDFGLASITFGDEQSATREALTPAYASPESFRCEEPSVGGDIYSLTATLYGLLAGRPPRFPAGSKPPSLATILSLHDRPVEDIPGVPAGMMTLLHGGLAADPAVRPASAVALRDELVALAGGPGAPAPPGTRRPDARRPDAGSPDGSAPPLPQRPPDAYPRRGRHSADSPPGQPSGPGARLAATGAADVAGRPRPGAGPGGGPGPDGTSGPGGGYGPDSASGPGAGYGPDGAFGSGGGYGPGGGFGSGTGYGPDGAFGSAGRHGASGAGARSAFPDPGYGGGGIAAGAMTGAPAPRRRRPSVPVLAAIAVGLVLVVGAAAVLGARLLGHSGPAAPAASGGSSHPSPPNVFGIATTTTHCPAASVPTAAARCPKAPECWGGVVEITGNVTASPLPCTGPHVWQTFAIAILPADAQTFDEELLKTSPSVRAVCSLRILLESRRGLARRIPPRDWMLQVMPPDETEFSNGARAYRCAAHSLRSSTTRAIQFGA